MPCSRGRGSVRSPQHSPWCRRAGCCIPRVYVTRSGVNQDRPIKPKRPPRIVSYRPGFRSNSLFPPGRWQLEKYKAPAFVGGPYQIWGLTGYILHRLVNDVIRQHLVVM